MKYNHEKHGVSLSKVFLYHMEKDIMCHYRVHVENPVMPWEDTKPKKVADKLSPLPI